MRSVVWVLSGAIVGCSASADDASGPCANRVGSYVVTYVERSGSCGNLGQNVVQVTSTTPTSAPGCTGGPWAASEQNCKTTGSTTCTAPDGVQITQKGACRWTEDGAGGTCELQVIFVGGGLDCSGMYEVRYRRQ